MMEELTLREKEIFELNIKCLSRNDICEQLCINKTTLNSHLKNMASKLGMPEKINIQYFLACEWLRMNNERIN